MSSTTAIATFLKNRINDLNEGLKVANEGLGNGTTLYPGKIAVALSGMGQTINALEDIVPLIEGMESPNYPHAAPFPNMEKPAAELPSDAMLKEIFCNRKETME